MVIVDKNFIKTSIYSCLNATEDIDASTYVV